LPIAAHAYGLALGEKDSHAATLAIDGDISMIGALVRD
jgi:hypothetical protein